MCLAILLLPWAVFAQVNEKPLMIIRFQSPSVNYQQSLFVAMSQALKTNPDMQFEVASFYENGEAGGRFAEQVAQEMIRMGLPAKRVRVSAQTDTQATAPEVQLFVR
jgi:TPR repeat protein